MSLDLAEPQPLTADESTDLDRLEVTIERGLRTFNEVGNALVAIRTGRLYRQTFASFEEYCEARWGLMRRHAYRLIDAANVVGNLSAGPTGHILPTSERQARPLTSLDPDQQQAAWSVVVDTAPNGKITTAHVAQVVEEKFRPKPVKARPEQPELDLPPPQREKTDREIRLAAIADSLSGNLETLLDDAMRAVFDQDHCVMKCDTKGAALARECYEAIVWKLNGRTFFGSALEGGGGSQVDSYCQASAGEVPMWGQRGIFRISVDGIEAIVEVGSPLYGGCVAFHALDLDKPFISETGYRSAGSLLSRPSTVKEACEDLFKGATKSLKPILKENRNFLISCPPPAVVAWKKAQDEEESLPAFDVHPPIKLSPEANMVVTLFTTKLGRKEWLIKLGGPSTWPLDKMDIDETILKAFAIVCREFDPSFTPGPHNFIKEEK